MLIAHHHRSHSSAVSIFLSVADCHVNSLTLTMSSKITTNVDQKLLRTTKFPAEFSQKVDTQKINIPVIKKYVVLDVHLPEELR